MCSLTWSALLYLRRSHIPAIIYILTRFLTFASLPARLCISYKSTIFLLRQKSVLHITPRKKNYSWPLLSSCTCSRRIRSVLGEPSLSTSSSSSVKPNYISLKRLWNFFGETKSEGLSEKSSMRKKNIANVKMKKKSQLFCFPLYKCWVASLRSENRILACPLLFCAWVVGSASDSSRLTHSFSTTSSLQWESFNLPCH